MKKTIKYSDIVEWFEPRNIYHIRAFKYLLSNGSWPAGFIPDKMEFPADWQGSLFRKIAERWIHHMEQYF